MTIGPGERDAWLACMQRALDEVVADATLRKEAYAQIAAFAEHMRNREAAGASAHKSGCTRSDAQNPALRFIAAKP